MVQASSATTQLPYKTLSSLGSSSPFSLLSSFQHSAFQQEYLQVSCDNSTTLNGQLVGWSARLVGWARLSVRRVYRRRCRHQSGSRYPAPAAASGSEQNDRRLRRSLLPDERSAARLGSVRILRVEQGGQTSDDITSSDSET